MARPCLRLRLRLAGPAIVHKLSNCKNYLNSLAFNAFCSSSLWNVSPFICSSRSPSPSPPACLEKVAPFLFMFSVLPPTQNRYAKKEKELAGAGSKKANSTAAYFACGKSKARVASRISRAYHWLRLAGVCSVPPSHSIPQQTRPDSVQTPLGVAIVASAPASARIVKKTV